MKRSDAMTEEAFRSAVESCKATFAESFDRAGASDRLTESDYRKSRHMIEAALDVFSYARAPDEVLIGLTAIHQFTVERSNSRQTPQINR
jgi:hypothetical protein